MSPEKLGQHFLTDASWQERIARAVRIDDGVWVEIGAGHGEMTTRLAQRASKVFAIELDPRLARRLREVTAPCKNVEVVESDVMAVDFENSRVASAFRFTEICPTTLHRPFCIACSSTRTGSPQFTS